MKSNLLILILIIILLFQFNVNSLDIKFFIVSILSIGVLLQFFLKNNKSKKTNIKFCFKIIILSFIYLFVFLNNHLELTKFIIINFILFNWFWFALNMNIIKLANQKSSFIYNHTDDKKTIFQTILSDYRFNFLSKLNLYVFCIELLIIFYIPLFIFNYYYLFLMYTTCTILVLVFLSFLICKNYLYQLNSKINESLQYIYNELVIYKPQIILYFSGNSKSTYQINMWLSTINKLNYNCIIIIRERHHYENLIDFPAPIVFLNTPKDIEKISSIPSLKIVFYVSNVGKNIHLVRDTKLKHVFIGHGDSDKAGSANNLMKLYDFMFVAGQAHIDRMQSKGVKTLPNYFIKIGRPQLELFYKNINKINNKKVNILYAPTWEGYYRDSCYSSLLTIGNNLCKNKNYTVTIKPHPLTGDVDEIYKKALKKIMKSNMNKDKNLYNYFINADILISDISSVVSDFLFFNKPIIIYKPDFVKNIYREYPITKCTYIIDDSSNIFELVKEILSNDHLAQERKKMRDYVMGDIDISAISNLNKQIEKIINND